MLEWQSLPPLLRPFGMMMMGSMMKSSGIVSGNKRLDPVGGKFWPCSQKNCRTIRVFSSFTVTGRSANRALSQYSWHWGAMVILLVTESRILWFPCTQPLTFSWDQNISNIDWKTENLSSFESAFDFASENGKIWQEFSGSVHFIKTQTRSRSEDYRY